MDIRSGCGYPAANLSNFHAHAFTFRGFAIASPEGLLQGLKCKDAAMQQHFFTLIGLAAKKAGRKKNWQESQTLWWQGQPIKRESDEYQQLLDEVYRAMFDQNADARKALLDTHDAVMRHSIGKNNPKETVLTEAEFCRRLHQNRDRLQEELRQQERLARQVKPVRTEPEVIGKGKRRKRG